MIKALYQGDCLEVMTGLAPFYNLVVTSPPYNLGTKYSKFQDKAPRAEFLAWCRQWATLVRGLMTEDASFFLNVGASPTNPLMPYQLLSELTEGDEPLFVLQNTFHWVKSISVNTRKGELISAGHFKPINSRRFVNDCHEFVFHLTKSGNVELDRKAAGVPYQDKTNIGRWGHSGGEDLRCRGNVWFCPYDTIKSRPGQRPHPATFPVGLVERCIKIHGAKEATRMLDPFMGLGTSGVAGTLQKIESFTGIELDEEYFNYAAERIG